MSYAATFAPFGRFFSLWTTAVLFVLPISPASVFVPAGGDLQAALNQAQAGDTITLQAGATFVGNYTLPVNNGRRWITIQSSAMDQLPEPGQRVSPSQASFMPKIVTPNAGPVLTFSTGANYYRIQGIELTVGSWVYTNNLVNAGTAAETSVSQLPHHLVFDRDYIHGDPYSGGKRGIALNSGLAVVENSYFENWTSDWQDTQAICGWNGPGPFTITNNHLEAGGEIVAFGGAPTAITGVIPSNIIVKDNEFYKPMNWWYGSLNYIGRNIRAKNHMEFKNGQNALIENNTFTNNFIGADQLGFMMLLNVRDENGQVPWATVSHIHVKRNLFQHTAAGVLMAGRDADNGGSGGDISFENNTWLDMGGYGGDGRMYQIQSYMNQVRIDHDTAFPTGYLFVFAYGPSYNLQVTNGIYTAGWGISGDGGVHGSATFDVFAPDAQFVNSAVIGGWSSGFTGPHFQNTLLLGSVPDAGFVNFAGNNIQLAANSPLVGQGTDGYNPGSTIAASSVVQAAGGASSLAVASTAIAPNGWVHIVSKLTGKCMDVNGGSTAPVTNIWNWQCWGIANQTFLFSPVEQGYKVTAQHSGLQFDLAGGNTAPLGAQLYQNSYWGGANQMFTLSTTPDGYVSLHPALNPLWCLSLANDSGTNGAQIVQQSCTGADDQLWQLIPAY